MNTPKNINHIELGNPIFNRMIFVLRRPVTKKNHLDYRFMNEKLEEIAPDIWAMPAYMKAKDSYSLFFIVTKIESGQTVVAFSEGHFENGDFRLGRPMVTGRGLNHLHQHDPQRALHVAHFLNLISKAAEGDWRMVTSD
ncbi:hypothetical protein [Acetilactobacillus jinshanensis]|uniref:Uncharacterized protein n=1 Tax=Acetilactobacillus jinshanensis TaxID=1720083 RepID=A0A4P6ZJG8_9LACO|nr:hypothetical protein [Acetilactobacillus jinshanensis]QBP17806.1 hypothetical protein ELX58_01170 [Acetilactobacillus jinshanensis]URL60668.1 hypothetical protein HGK75_01200 [uncultured bacterium]